VVPLQAAQYTKGYNTRVHSRYGRQGVSCPCCFVRQAHAPPGKGLQGVSLMPRPAGWAECSPCLKYTHPLTSMRTHLQADADRCLRVSACGGGWGWVQLEGRDSACYTHQPEQALCADSSHAGRASSPISCTRACVGAWVCNMHKQGGRPVPAHMWG
jgi:hypothetical protein